MKLTRYHCRRFFASFCLAVVFLLSGCNDPRSANASGGLFGSRGGSRDPASSDKTPSSGIDLYNISADLIRDPINTRNIRVDDGVVRISGLTGEQGLEDITVDFPADVELDRNGNTFICTITCTSSGSGFGTIELENCKLRNNYIRVRYDKNGISFPNVMRIADTNLSLAEGEIPENENSVTLSYITESGSRERAKEVLNEVKELSDKICKGLSDDYDKLRAISRWVSENIYYDHPAFSAGIPKRCLTLEYILENRAGVCGSYANMTSALCQAQGILCYNVTGEGITKLWCYAEQTSGEAHEWNYAFVGGRGVWVDSGFNSFNHLYAGGQTEEGDISCRYFDPGNEYFALDHKAKTISNRDFFDPDLIKQ